MTRRALHRFLTLLLRWRKDMVIPIAFLLCAGGVLAFIEIASEVEEREWEVYDRAILLAMREPDAPDDPRGAVWVEEMGRDVTALGGVAVLTGLSLASVGMMLLLRKPRLAIITAIAIAGGLLTSDRLKQLFARTRPDLVPHGAAVSTASFPSGHAMMAAIVYLTLGVLLARTQPDRAIRLYLIGVSTAITLLVGVSRVYLGVHWPTDVLAGWIIGGVWAVMFWVITSRIDPIK